MTATAETAKSAPVAGKSDATSPAKNRRNAAPVARSGRTHLRNVARLLESPYFSRMDLKVTIFDPSLFDMNLLPAQLQLFAAFSGARTAACSDYFSVAKKAALTTAHCCLCSDAIDYVPEMLPVIAVCPSCAVICHLRCLAASWYQSLEINAALIPSDVSCSQCGAQTSWRLVADMATKLRQYALSS